MFTAIRTQLRNGQWRWLGPAASELQAVVKWVAAAAVTVATSQANPKTIKGKFAPYWPWANIHYVDAHVLIFVPNMGHDGRSDHLALAQLDITD